MLLAISSVTGYFSLSLQGKFKYVYVPDMLASNVLRISEHVVGADECGAVVLSVRAFSKIVCWRSKEFPTLANHTFTQLRCGAFGKKLTLISQ